MSNGCYKVSVVIPVFNSGETALLSINSVLNQSYECSEIIIVDDGSEDNSYELLQRLYGDIKKIKIVKIKNRGAAGARNYGVSISNNCYVAFLDSDDVWDLQKIEKQINYIKSNPDVSMVGALTNIKNFRIGGIFKLNNYAVIGLKNLLFKNYFQTSTVLISRASLDAVGCFPEGRRYAEEGDLFMRIAAKNKCVLLNENLVNYADGKSGFGVSGLSSNLISMELGELSNIFNVYKRRDCGLFLFLSAFFFSFLKFIRRFFVKYIFQILKV